MLSIISHCASRDNGRNSPIRAELGGAARRSFAWEPDPEPCRVATQSESEESTSEAAADAFLDGVVVDAFELLLLLGLDGFVGALQALEQLSFAAGFRGCCGRGCGTWG